MIPKIKKTISEGRGTSATLMFRKSLPTLSPHPEYLPAKDLARMIGCSISTIRGWKLPFEKEDVERHAFSHGAGMRKIRVRVFNVKEAKAHAGLHD